MTPTPTYIPSSEPAAVEVPGINRSTFLLPGALAPGAAYGASVVAPFVSDALAGSGASDVDILNFALTLECLESDGLPRQGQGRRPQRPAHKLAKEFGAYNGPGPSLYSKQLLGAFDKPLTKAQVLANGGPLIKH